MITTQLSKVIHLLVRAFLLWNENGSGISRIGTNNHIVLKKVMTQVVPLNMASIRDLCSIRLSVFLKDSLIFESLTLWFSLSIHLSAKLPASMSEYIPFVPSSFPDICSLGPSISYVFLFPILGRNCSYFFFLVLPCPGFYMRSDRNLGSWIFTKLETRCPWAPWPSHTPIIQRSVTLAKLLRIT